MIEWKARGDARELAATADSRITDFTVHHPEADTVQNQHDRPARGGAPPTASSSKRPEETT